MARQVSRGVPNGKCVAAGKRSSAPAVHWVVAALLAAGATSRAAGQTVRVELRDSVTSAPLIGALVSAIDSVGRVRADALSSDLGIVSLRLPYAGSWTINVRRIGVSPRRLTGVNVGGDATVNISLSLSSLRQQLTRVRVTADAGVCGRAPTGADRASALWEQISLALRASTITRADSLNAPPLHVIERVSDLSDNLVEKSTQITRDRYDYGRPYSAVDPDSLASHGYVIRESDGGLRYFAPDENVLLSDAFLATHCFSTPKKDEDPALAELRFKPARGRTVAEIEGTAFVDTLSGELRRIEFRYVAPRTLIAGTAKYAGGDVALLRLPNGKWIVTSWAIRMPLFDRITAYNIVLRGYRSVNGTVDPVGGIKPPD